MRSNLPVPVDISLPSKKWHPVDPQDLGVGDAAFVAVRPEPDAPGYTPILSVRGDFRVDASGLDAIGDESLQVMRKDGASAHVVKRRGIGSETAPAIVQLIEIETTIDGSRFDLYQAQVIQAIVDVKALRKQIVLMFAVTCTFAQWSVVGPEFQDFVAEAVIVPGAAELLSTALD